jgi:hypothetical protein
MYTKLRDTFFKPERLTPPKSTLNNTVAKIGSFAIGL